MLKMNPSKQSGPQTQAGTGPRKKEVIIISTIIDVFYYTECKHISYHSAHSSRFLCPEGLHHLEDIHHSLSLAPLNGSGYGTEHATAAHCVTAGETHPHWHTVLGRIWLQLTCSASQWACCQSSFGLWTPPQSHRSQFSG